MAKLPILQEEPDYFGDPADSYVVCIPENWRNPSSCITQFFKAVSSPQQDCQSLPTGGNWTSHAQDYGIFNILD